MANWFKGLFKRNKNDAANGQKLAFKAGYSTGYNAGSFNTVGSKYQGGLSYSGYARTYDHQQLR